MSTATATAPAPARLTGDEFLRQYGDQSGVELDQGLLLRTPLPGLLHGEVCANAYHLLREFVKPRNLGRLFTNDSFVRTRTDPDSYRGADVLYISYQTLPADRPTPVGAYTPPLELVVEVRSASDSVADMTNKATEHIAAGVKVVLVLDPDLEVAAVYRADEYPIRFHTGDEVTLADVLPGFAVPVKRFFE